MNMHKVKHQLNGLAWGIIGQYTIQITAAVSKHPENPIQQSSGRVLRACRTPTGVCSVGLDVPEQAIANQGQFGSCNNATPPIVPLSCRKRKFGS